MSTRRLARALRHIGLALAAALAVAAAATSAAPGTQQAPATLVIRQALAVPDPGDTFPAEHTARAVTLPDDWSATWPRHDGAVWYRVRFDTPPTPQGQPLALYVERACTRLAVQLNGEPVFTGGQVGHTLTQDCYRSQLVVLPRALLQSHDNVLDLKLTGFALEHVAARQRAAGLSTLRIGPEAALEPLYRAQRLRNITAAQVTSAVLLVLGGLMFGLSRVNRRDSHLVCFGLLLVGWAVWGARLWVQDWPLRGPSVEVVLAGALAFLLACGLVFVLRWGGLRHPVIEAALAAQCLVMPATLLLAGEHRLFSLASAWYVLFAVELTLALAAFLGAAWRHWRRAFPALLGLGAAVLAVVWLEVMVQLGLVPALRVPLFQLALPALFVAVSLRITQLFARAMRAAEAGRSTLESRVQEISAEIERNFAQLAELRVEQVTQRERKRIAADLHDDLGAKLLTIVHTSDNDRISTLAREALEEMRLSVRGLTGKPVRVSDALADWRVEVVARLGQAGIEADWRAPTEEGEQLLAARAYVQATRILREAVSNIIKHSGASRCKVRCAIGENDFRLTIQDNGNGIPLELDGRLDRGHGMSSMKHRAKQLQGQCLVESGPGYGTVIRLTLPL